MTAPMTTCPTCGKHNNITCSNAYHLQANEQKPTATHQPAWGWNPWNDTTPRF